MYCARVSRSVVDAQPITQLLELLEVLFARRMDVFGLRDELDLFVAVDRKAFEDRLEFRQVLAVDDQQLVLVELHLERNAGIEHGNAQAAVVEQQILVIVENALQHRQVDVLAVQVEMAAVALVAGFQHQVHFVPQWVQELEEQIQHRFSAGGTHQNGNLDPRVRVLVNVVPVTGAGNHLQIVRGPDGVRQQEASVTRDVQMRFELVFRNVQEAAPRRGRNLFAAGIGQEPLQKTHRLGSRNCGTTPSQTAPGPSGET